MYICESKKSKNKLMSAKTIFYIEIVNIYIYKLVNWHMHIYIFFMP